MKMPTEEREEIRRMKQRLSLIMSEEAASHGLNFKPRPDHVIVTTWPKCGTTWMQQIVHQVRSGDDMSFDEITDVIPYIEHAYDLDMDLDAKQNYQPRCYKTHAWYPSCPKGAKYIVIYREPCAAFYSEFNFFKGWFFVEGKISLHGFVKEFLLDWGVPQTKGQVACYFLHLLSRWEHRNDPNVLFLFFEDMKDDLEGVVRIVSDFMGINEQERIQKAVEMSSFEFMKKNERKFSEVRYPRTRNAICGLPTDLVASKVVSGSATKGRELMDEETKEIIQAKWLELVEKQTGFQDYNELRRALKNEKNSKKN